LYTGVKILHTKSASMSRSVYESLVSEIIRGVHPSGSRLRESDIASRLGVSRTPVREALQRLHANGFIELTKDRGAQVAFWGDDEIDDIFELRTLLEGHAARRAAERGVEKLAELEELCAQMEARLPRLDQAAFDEITELNMRFHGVLHQSAGSRLLPSLLSGVIQVPLVRHTFHHYSTAELSRSFSQHRDLLAAVRAHDGQWAEAIMHSHVLAARASLLRRRADGAEDAHDEGQKTGPGQEGSPGRDERKGRDGGKGRDGDSGGGQSWHP
jgi:DNA-binding GntR family transcriptional regulator